LSNFTAACPLFVLTLLPSSDTCLLGKSLSLRPQQSVDNGGHFSSKGGPRTVEEPKHEDGERRLFPPQTMAAIFLQKEAQEPLKNQNITAIGGPTQRSIYKGPTRPPRLLLKENSCHCLWWKKSTLPVFMFWFFNGSWASF
jgi:hypothetical protein